MTPRFIVLEGGEGVGKTTQSALLKQAFEAAKVACLVSREPGGTALGGEVRRLVKEKNALYEGLTSGQELMLFCAARVSYLYEVVKPTLEGGQWLISDRFVPSSLAYQGYAGGLEPDAVVWVNEQTTGPIKPDLVIVLDQPYEIGLARRETETGDGTRMEDKGADYHKRVRDGYLRYVQDHPQDCVRIEATQTIAAVHAQILVELEMRFGLRLPVQAA